VVAILLLTGRIASADSIAVGDTLHILNPGGAIWGGVFQVDDLSLAGPIDLLTFCVQQDQDINDVDEFTVTGIGNSTEDGDPLDAETAWIYSQFRQGLLTTYTEDEIQAAIWLIEQEAYFTNHVFSSLNPTLQSNANALITAAENAVLGGYVNTDVKILNLVFKNSLEPAQDLLVLDSGSTIQDVHAPEPATLVLVGSGIAGLIRRHSKRRRNP
jgi:hypothetical protein